MQALEDAIIRGVKVTLVMEIPSFSNKKISFNPLRNFSKSLRENVTFYVWPLENRPLSEEGRHGSLHAKVAVSDSNTAFITSANLTDYAMNLNMEMGMLVTGIDVPRQIGLHFNELISRNIITFLEDLNF